MEVLRPCDGLAGVAATAISCIGCSSAVPADSGSCSCRADACFARDVAASRDCSQLCTCLLRVHVSLCIRMPPSGCACTMRALNLLNILAMCARLNDLNVIRRYD